MQTRIVLAVLAALAVLALIVPAPAAAQRRDPQARSPEAFMTLVLRRLNDRDAPSLELPHTTRWYDRQFLALMRDNESLALRRLDGPDLDYDPVCQCQTNDGRYAIRRIVRRPGGRFADVRMRQAFPDDPEGAYPNDYTIVLVRNEAGWRIWDVISEGESVRAMLTRHNACLRARSRDSVLHRCLAA